MKRLIYATLLAFAVLAVAGALMFGGRRPGPEPTLDASVNNPAPPGQTTAFHGATLEPSRTAPDFTLVDQHGDEFRLSDQVGDVVEIGRAHV